jgi:hypothetical protein
MYYNTKIVNYHGCNIKDHWEMNLNAKLNQGHCALKRKRSELSKLVIKPVRSSDFSSRGQVDLIDYQSVPDSGYKWVLHYQDHFTKFSILHPCD